MKQTTNMTGMVTLSLFTFLTVALSAPTFAGAKTGDPMEFKFIGKIKDHPVFQLNLNNDEAGEYFINIKDKTHGLLYSETVKAKEPNFSRKYQLDLLDDELLAPGFDVTVEVISAKTHKSRLYKISSQTTVKE